MANPEWAKKDFYAVLGVSKDATADEIKKAYRKLARAHHPDSNAGDKAAEEKFKAIAEAYDVVGDAAKRKEYDELRAMVASGGFRPGGAGPGGFDASQFYTSGGFGDGGFSGDAGGFGGLGGLFGSMFGGGGRRTAAHRGQDITTDATISFTDAVEGVTISLRSTTESQCTDCGGSGARHGTARHTCPDCGGSGMRETTAGGSFWVSEPCTSCAGRGYLIDEVCPTCQGAGRARSERTIQAKIPAGVKDGQTIKVRGKGAPGEGGAPAGDLLIRVKVQEHPLFGRRGDHITLKVPIAFHEAALGAEVTVPTLGGGPVTVKIPAGTPNGRTFRVRGRGVKRSNGQTGDLLVTVEVQVPARLSDDARKAVEALREATPETDVRAALFASGTTR